MQTITSHNKTFFVSDADASEAQVIAKMSENLAHTLLATLQGKARGDQRAAHAALQAEIDADVRITQAAIDSADTQARLTSHDKIIAQLENDLKRATVTRANYLDALKPERNASRITIDRNDQGVYTARGASKKATREQGAPRTIAKGYRVIATGARYSRAMDAVIAAGVDDCELSHAPDGTPYYAAYIAADLKKANPKFEKIVDATTTTRASAVVVNGVKYASWRDAYTALALTDDKRDAKSGIAQYNKAVQSYAKAQGWTWTKEQGAG